VDKRTKLQKDLLDTSYLSSFSSFFPPFFAPLSKYLNFWNLSVFLDRFDWLINLWSEKNEGSTAANWMGSFRIACRLLAWINAYAWN
jgi:hypothetical protein